jgi:hypothetical protein
VRKERPENQFSPELNRYDVLAFAQTFMPRFDCYPRQHTETGKYYVTYHEVTIDLLRSHVSGKRHPELGYVTLGAYALDKNSRASWVCFDADDEEEWQGLRQLAGDLKQEHIPSYLEPSRRGGHLWLFFPEPLPGRDARRFAKQLLWEQDLPNIEVYPKQDELRTGPGSLVRLPLGIHWRADPPKRYHFIDTNGKPTAPTIREQLRLLANPECIPPSFVDIILALAPESHPLPFPLLVKEKTFQAAGEEVSDRIKNSISVYDFVSQFIQLDRGGKALCPFHDDHEESFSVHRERNFWRCFATHCDKGYTVIDFWMYWRGIDFKQAVKELAAMLL